MLTVAKLSPGQEAYYERSVAGGLDDYYAGRGESPGVWVGRGAAELELDGVVGEGELGRLIAGRHPLTSAVLRRHPPRKQISVESIDPATGERGLEVKTLSPVAGYDLVFSPPKSVSLLHALGDDDLRHAVNQAHLAAWQAALSYLEQRACVTRRGKNGVLRERGPGFVAAAYQHRTSRAQDPHLHTHVVVANMGQGSDGVWRALDGEPLLKRYRLAAGYLYQSQLRYELTGSLGVEWREPVNGMAEIAGVPEQALRAFSQRRAQVLDYLERQGSSGFYAAKVAALETRDRKQPIDLPRMRLEWAARASEHGLGRRELEGLLGQTVPLPLDEHEIAAHAARLAGPDGLTGTRSTFSGTDVVMAWAQAHARGAPTEQVLSHVERFLAADETVSIAPATVGRPAAFSTAELLRHEQAALRLSAHSRGAPAPTVSAATLEQVTREHTPTLSGEQLTMVQAAASSPERVVCVVGYAGAGKTTALAALAEAYRRDGHATFGAAPSGIAAANLAAQTGMPSGTLHRLLIEARRQGGLPQHCLLVVDEAAMADTRTLTHALLQVERAQGKAVLVGDPAQLPAVGPGGLYAAIVERNGAIELQDNRRQHDDLERRALALLRDGHSHDYLVHAAQHGRLIVAADRTEAKAQLVADWWQAARGDLADSAMIAYRRADVAELNSVARSLLDLDGQLGRHRLRLGDGTELAAGDRVLCTCNDQRLKIVNGNRGTITTIDRAQRTLEVDLDDHRRVTLPARYFDAGHLTHAYALTGHKTQGLTLEEAFVLADDRRALREWGYVALSRARRQTRLYTTANELEPDAPPRRPEPTDPLDRLADALTTRAAETIAVDAPTTRPEPTERSHLVKTSRQLREQHQALERERRDASRLLHQTRDKLAGLGLIRRARDGSVLRDQIRRGETNLARLDRELELVDAQLRQTRERARDFTRTPTHLEPSRGRRHTIGRAAERRLDREIEL